LHLFEGFGLPAAEAMACKTPVVATTAGALKEIIPPQCGITVEPRNSKALKDAVLELLRDDVRRQRMGNEGRKWTESNYAWPVAAKNTYDVYNDVIEEYGSRK
jgi:glycosyltransferase involved in cell wall biosynthesis